MYQQSFACMQFTVYAMHLVCWVVFPALKLTTDDDVWTDVWTNDDITTMMIYEMNQWCTRIDVWNETTECLCRYLQLVFVNCYNDWTPVEGTMVQVRDIVTPVMHCDVVLHLASVYIGMSFASFSVALVFWSRAIVLNCFMGLRENLALRLKVSTLILGTNHFLRGRSAVWVGWTLILRSTCHARIALILSNIFRRNIWKPFRNQAIVLISLNTHDASCTFSIMSSDAMG